MLICPVCKKLLIQDNKSFKCENNHNFDISKEGYVNLYLQSSKNSGDNKLMVKARTSFLEKGFYEPLLNEINTILKQYNPSILVDAGCGEGYYTNRFQLDNCQTYAFDLSKDALKKASKNRNHTQYILSSIYNLPLQDACADTLISIFSPFASEEYYRVLKNNGIFIKVDPNKKHLYEIKEILYDTVYENEIMNLNDSLFTLDSYKEVTFTMHLNKEDIEHLFMMTPYFYKTSKETSEKLIQYESLDCTASFIIYIYKKV